MITTLLGSTRALQENVGIKRATRLHKIGVVKVRISRQPSGTVDGISLGHYHPGRCYDLPASLAQYLVAEGFGIFEMRHHVRSKRVRPTDRRKAHDPPFSSEGLSFFEL
jgi:hypothetical protein